MKPIEDALASASFRRVILPGIVLTAGVHPLIAPWISKVAALYGINGNLIFIVEILTFGLALGSATQWIYYIYEGFRWLWLTEVARRLSEKRLNRLTTTLDRLGKRRHERALSAREENTYSKTNERLLDFPRRLRPDGSPEPYSERPTRLGNIIASYELYAQTRYGVDGVAFWYHLLSLGSDAAGTNFEEKYAFAESLVLTSFAGVLVMLLHCIVLSGFLLRAITPAWKVVPSTDPILSICIALVGAAVWLVFYAASLQAHRDAGAVLRSIVDAAIPTFIAWAQKAALPAPAETRKRVDELARYLQYLRPPKHPKGTVGPLADRGQAGMETRPSPPDTQDPAA